MNGVVNDMIVPLAFIVASTVEPWILVKNVPDAVSVKVYVKVSLPKMDCCVLVAVMVGSIVFPPIFGPPKCASACEFILVKVA